MVYKKLTISPADERTREILIALLAEQGAEGFEELPDTLIAFFEGEVPDTAAVEEMLLPMGVTHTWEEVEKTNWNKEWESNFQPVIVDDFCTVRADFHNIPVTTAHEIIITPKMSFGTGHHATTRLMIKHMRDLGLQGKKVLDFGTGTGILAILAQKLGATEVVAIDNDEWSVTNAIENAERNKTVLGISQGSLEDVQQTGFDTILANINRHILLHYMRDLAAKTREGGFILMSGLLTDDEAIITKAAVDAGLKHIKTDTENNWIALLFSR